MGCWNKTCGMTNLPIFSGDEVVWFLLVQGASPQARSSYSSEHWCSIPLPIYGTYDDYGWIEPHPGQEWKLELFKEHFQNLVKLNDDAGENPFNSFEMLNESLRNDSFAIKERDFSHSGPGAVYKNCLLGDFFVHKATFDELTSHYQGPWSDEIYTRAEVEENVLAFYAWVPAKLNSLDPNDPDFAQKKTNLVYSLRNGRLVNEDLTEFVSTLSRKPKYEGHFAGAPVIRIWGEQTALENGYPASLFISYNKDAIPFTERIDAAMLFLVMTGLRKQFFPSGHEGSQDNMWGLHEQFAKTYQNRITEYKQLYEED